MSNKKTGNRFSNDWSEDELNKIYSEIVSAVTIPVGVKVEGSQKILDFSRVEQILKNANLIVVQDCGCRVERNNCSSPRDVCISIDEEAEKSLEIGVNNPRKVSLEEALGKIKKAHEAGLVSMAYQLEGRDKISPICNCCSCCCHTLSGLVRFGLAKHVLSSDMISKTNENLCINCGVCADRCQFNARRLEKGKMVYDSEQCFGCGLCVSACPVTAIELVKR
ncbi:4Fe-4S binding protein [Candidatus Bathyarchaeota archaeon]|nr:4Fe-4S binding protein [Candidatus Bathyarchaeota archaeon]